MHRNRSVIILLTVIAFHITTGDYIRNINTKIHEDIIFTFEETMV